MGRFQKQYAALGGRANYNEGGGVEADTLANEQDSSRSAQVQVEFVSDYEGQEYGFNPSQAGPPDLNEFLEGESTQKQGDMVPSNDGFLYVMGGPQLHKELQLGWYRSTGNYSGNSQSDAAPAPAGTGPQ